MEITEYLIRILYFVSVYMYWRVNWHRYQCIMRLCVQLILFLIISVNIVLWKLLKIYRFQGL